MSDQIQLNCPLPLTKDDRILLAHGGGGKLTQQLIEKIFLPAFDNQFLSMRHDGAIVPIDRTKLAFTTDSFVVRPLSFPGGTIGDLAINGTVNDLAMCGARPLYLSAGLILEEGLPMETLRTVIESMRDAAKNAGVELVTGDTKVVERGHGDGLYVNTSGIGVIETDLSVGPLSVQSGDAVLVSGEIGAHGIAVMSVREGLEFESPIMSDTASLWPAVKALVAAEIEVHCLRDLTRGGLASALNEIATTRGVEITINEELIPVSETVHGACEVLGFDPLYVANEGCMAIFIPESQVNSALTILRNVEVSRNAVRIGEVGNENTGLVILKSSIGGSRVVDLLSGEQLPRIC
jgi:hydrogenase expression/formation protein HypE